MTFIWRPHWKHEKVDMSCCRAPVRVGPAGHSQCSRRGIVEEDGVLWCKQHAPSVVRARDEAREDKWRQQNREFAERQRKATAKHNATQAVLDAAVKWHRTESRDSTLALTDAIDAYERLLEDAS